MPNPENNLLCLFNEVLDRTGHKKLSRANRAHQWMQNHSLAGPCLTFLNDCITEENFVTVEQMNLFEAVDDLPGESEIDTLLAEYLGETSIDLASMHTSSLQQELSQAEKYSKALGEQERLLRRHCNKLREEISIKSAEIPIPESEDAASTHEAYNEAWKQGQSKLSNTLEMFSTLLTSDENLDERFTPAPSSEMIQMFHNTVNEIFRKHFREVEEKEAVAVDERAREITSLVEHLGGLNYQRTKLQCQEAESTELDRFIGEILESTGIYPVDAAHLRSLFKPSLNETDSLQQKIALVSERLENLSRESVVRNLLVTYRQGLSRREESDYEFMKEIASFCVKSVDLLTLLACLAYARVWKIDALLVLFDFTRQKLNEHRKQHLLAEMKLTKLKSREEVESDKDNSLSMNSSSDEIKEEEKQIPSFVANYLRMFSATRRQLDELEHLIFDGPVRSKILFSQTLQNDEALVRQQFYQFEKQFKMWNAQFDENMRENEKLDEVTKCYRSLGLLFLANPDGKMLRSNLKQFRNMGSKTITIVPGRDSSLHVDAKKVNQTSC